MSPRREVVEASLAAAYAVQEPPGRPIPGAFTALCVSGVVLGSGKTDEHGEWAHEHPEDGDGKLLVIAPPWVPSVIDVPLGPGRHVVTLEAGAAVSGRVIVDGEEPGEPLPLALICSQELVHLDEMGIEWKVFDRLPSAGRWFPDRTDAHGTFAFRGLPTDWTGQLRLPVEYRLEDPTQADRTAPNAIALHSPVEGLEVRVVRRLTLTGRVIEFPSAEPTPVAGAIVIPAFRFPRTGGVFSPVDTEADEKGRFTFALPCKSLLGGYLQIGPPDRAFFRTIDLEPAEVDGELDLGDLALIESRLGAKVVPLHVVDTAGYPIRGAVAAPGFSSPASHPTDEEGRTAVAFVLPGLTTLAVYAAGYEAAHVPVPAELSEELEVVLVEGIVLELRFVCPDGILPPGIAARLAAPENPLRIVEIPRNMRGYMEAGCTAPRTVVLPDGTVVLRLWSMEGARVVLNDLKPGIPMQLRVEGLYSGVIQEESIPPLQPREHRIQEVALAREPRTLSGRVLDESGNPLPQAWVKLTWFESDFPEREYTMPKRVDEDGCFRLTDLYGPTVYLSADADGFAKYVDPEFPLPQEDSYIEIRLSRGNTVTVTVEDDVGRRLPATVFAVLPNGATVSMGQQVEEQEGVYVMHGVPNGPITLRAYIAAIPHDQTHDGRVPECRFVVPVSGELHVRVRLFDESQVDERWLLTLTPNFEGGPPVRYAYLYDPVFPYVTPGSYTLVMRRFPRGFGDKSEFEEKSLPVPIQVHQGERVEVEVLQL
ncbi:MAG: carboxypeptidase-like regulatory domain-containing protein [Planctomycetota bacterium]